jgi:hypothetical protein
MTVTDAENETMYDILIPPGVPRKMIIDISKKFSIEVVERKERISFANMEGDVRELLAFRGKYEELQKVEKYLREEMENYVKG